MIHTSVMNEVDDEVTSNLNRWGVQFHQNGTGKHALPVLFQKSDKQLADEARQACEDAAAGGVCTWRLILDEEVREAFAERVPARLRAELVQVAAVVAEWMAAIDSGRTEYVNNDLANAA